MCYEYKNYEKRRNFIKRSTIIMGIQKRIIKVPTGEILVLTAESGKGMECLGLADYGKMANIKADFLGIGREISGVSNDSPLLPLEEKWVVTISTQSGCSMGCKFCEVPQVGPGINLTENDLSKQIHSVVALHPEVTYTKRLNLHYARMGEPTWNPAVLAYTEHRLIPEIDARFPGGALIHPVISTMLPKANRNLLGFLKSWCELKNGLFSGNAGLQFSINSTSDMVRDYQFSGSSLNLQEISDLAKELPDPIGRKYALNFAITPESIVSGEVLRELFDPARFMCKITPIHQTKSAVKNGILCESGYTEYTPYRDIETSLKEAGFDVLVFIPSLDEDQSRITCGNAILSDLYNGNSK